MHAADERLRRVAPFPIRRHEVGDSAFGGERTVARGQQDFSDEGKANILVRLRNIETVGCVVDGHLDVVKVGASFAGR